MPRLTQSQIRYLHAVYLAQSDAGGIRSVALSRALSVSKASVSRMVKLLAQMGLVAVEAGGVIALTPCGRAHGRDIDAKMAGLYPFFADFLGLGQTEATDCAYHFMSEFSEGCVNSLLAKRGSVWPAAPLPAAPEE